MVEVEGGDCSELVLFRGEGREEKRPTYVINNDKHAPAYIDVKPELWFIHLFLLCLEVDRVDHEGGFDVGVMAEGGVHNVWLSGVEVDLEGGRSERQVSGG